MKKKFYGNRQARQPKQRIGNPRNVKIFTDKLFTTSTKGTAHRVEYYPVKLSDLVDTGIIGRDVDVRLLSYKAVLTFATGNITNTVQVGIAHTGPWVRRGPTDGFNQNAIAKPLTNRRVVFNKKSLSRSEREFLNPQQDATEDNFIVFKVIDTCGVIPGVSFTINFKAKFIRQFLPIAVDGAGNLQTDSYADQDVNNGTSSGGTQPSTVNDVPKVIRVGNLGNTTDVTAKTLSPTVTVYENPVFGGGSEGLKITHTTGANIVGLWEPPKNRFENQDLIDNQAGYTSAGYEGTLSLYQK